MTLAPALTLPFRTLPGLTLYVDCYPPAGPGPHPALLYAHGGALIFGARSSLPPELVQTCADAGYALLSFDYRLAPESKLPEIAADLDAALAWAAGEGAARLNLDAARLGMIGRSAGGYLTLLAGTRRAGRSLRALVAFYGYGDIVEEWYTQPDPFYCQQPLVSEADAWSAVGETPLAEPPAGSERFLFYLYCRQQGLWPPLVMGVDPAQAPEAFASFCPQRLVTAAYPPTLLLHGTADTDVPYGQSAQMAAALEVAGVPHELVTIDGGGHGFDSAGLAEPQVRLAYQRLLAFLQRYL